MGPRALARWQWADYADFHQDRRNKWIHIIAVPCFILGNLLSVAGAVIGTLAIEVYADLQGYPAPWWSYGLPLLGLLPGLLVSTLAIAAQGKGHKLEVHPPKPFTGPANVIGRIFVEQWVTWPRFILRRRAD